MTTPRKLYRVVRHEVEQPSDPLIRHIPLTIGKFAIVDASDYEWLMQWNWLTKPHRSGHTFYAKRNRIDSDGPGSRSIYMHRQIVGVSADECVDHINHNPLDNRRSNLRIASIAENTRNQSISGKNSSGYKGVVWHKAAKKWMAQITVNYEHLYLGLFDTPEDAHQAYRKASEEHHGQFACAG